MANIRDFYNFLDSIAPFNTQEEWDNSGALVLTEREIKKVLICLDATLDSINEAKEKNAELIISHHPVIFSPLSFLNPCGAAETALKNGIGIISCHTNLDISEYCADNILSNELKEKLGFIEKEILDITKSTPTSKGFGKIGEFKTQIPFSEVKDALKRVYDCEHLICSKTTKDIKTLAFCCGGGSSYLEKIAELNIDAFITSDCKHSSFIFANNTNTALFCPTHYEMEKPMMKKLISVLQKAFPEIKFILSEKESSPSCAL